MEITICDCIDVEPTFDYSQKDKMNKNGIVKCHTCFEGIEMAGKGFKEVNTNEV